ncbi:MAG: RsmD family RNA methyltransferase [Polyangiales bacterium]
MRIVGGTLSGRRLRVNVKAGTRPTPDRVREGVASALDSRDAIEDAVVLDLFSGTGAWSFELLSRGARGATAVDISRPNINEINANAQALQVQDRLRTITADLFRVDDVIRKIGDIEVPFDLVVMDAPYDSVQRAVSSLIALIERGTISTNAWIAIEHATNRPPELPDSLALVSNYRYGDTGVALVTKKEAS